MGLRLVISIKYYYTNKFRVMDNAEIPPLKLNWISGYPVWVEK
jgi:hypothetical protein